MILAAVNNWHVLDHDHIIKFSHPASTGLHATYDLEMVTGACRLLHCAQKLAGSAKWPRPKTMLGQQ